MCGGWVCCGLLCRVFVDCGCCRRTRHLSATAGAKLARSLCSVCVPVVSHLHHHFSAAPAVLQSQGILSPRMFTMMILMAIITTCMTAPGMWGLCLGCSWVQEKHVRLGYTLNLAACYLPSAAVKLSAALAAVDQPVCGLQGSHCVGVEVSLTDHNGAVSRHSSNDPPVFLCLLSCHRRCLGVVQEQAGGAVGRRVHSSSGWRRSCCRTSNPHSSTNSPKPQGRSGVGAGAAGCSRSHDG